MIPYKWEGVFNFIVIVALKVLKKDPSLCKYYLGHVGMIFMYGYLCGKMTSAFSSTMTSSQLF